MTDLYEYIQLRNEIRSKIDKIPIAGHYSIITPDFVNKYSELLLFLSDQGGIPLVSELPFVSKGDIIDPDHFLSLCSNVRHVISEIVNGLARKPFSKSYIVDYVSILERARLNMSNSTTYSLLNTVYSNGLAPDKSNWVFLPSFKEEFDSLPTVGEKYRSVSIIGGTTVENGSLIIPRGGGITLLTTNNTVYPNLRLIINFTEAIRSGLDVDIYIYIYPAVEDISGSFYTLDYIMIYLNLIPPWYYIYVSYYLNGLYIENSRWINYTPNIFSIEIYTLTNRAELVFDGLLVYSFDIPSQYTGFKGGNTYYQLQLYNYSGSNINVVIDKIEFSNIVAKHEVEQGTMIYADEWNKLRDALIQNHDRICNVWDKTMPTENNLLALDDFNEFPSKNYWDLSVDYSGNVWVYDGRLIVDGGSYIKLERSVEVDVPIRVACTVGFTPSRYINFNVFTGLLTSDNVFRGGLIIRGYRGTYDYMHGLRIVYRDKTSSEVGRQTSGNLTTAHGCIFKDVFLWALHPTSLWSDSITYVPTNWAKFALHIQNNSPSGVRVSVDNVIGYRYRADTYTEYLNLFR
ncbi:MAG: hypothetical protein QXK24_06740 [Ignisphaera sp.]